MDLDSAMKLHPTLDVWEDLRGKSKSWSKTSDNSLAPNIFSFGKYHKHEIESVVEKDFQYIVWICENRNGTDNGKYAMGLPKVKEYFTNLEAEKLNEKNDMIATFNNLIEAGTATFARESNLKVYESFGYFTEVVNGIAITFEFNGQMFLRKEYRGFEFGFPSIDGKYKTMKFKNLKYTFEKIETEDGTFKVNVLDVNEVPFED